MVTLERTRIKNFFSVSSAEVVLEDQGLVVIHGRVGSGKTALACESILYGLYGTSFEYGQNPGQDVKKNTEKEYSVTVWLRSDSDRFRISRGKDSEHNINGLELHRINDDGSEDRLTRGTIKDTQKLITNGLLKISERLFRRSVVCSTDMGKFPDASDSEKKSVLDELLELWVIQGAHEETAGYIKDIRSELGSLKRELQTATDRLREEEEFEIPNIPDLEDSLVLVRNSIKENATTLDEYKDLFKIKSKKLKENIDKAKARITNVPKSLTSTIAEVKAEIRELARIEKLVEKGKCSECGQDTDKLCQSDHVGHKGGLLSKLERLEHEKDSLEEDIEKAKGDLDSILEREKKLFAQYREATSEVEESTTAMLRKEARILDSIESAKTATGRLEKVKATANVAREKVTMLETKLMDEEILEECFSNKGFRLSIIRSVIPFMNQEAERVSILLGTPIRVKFSLKGSNESYSGSLVVEVHNPIGAWKYHGSSAGERRTIDIIILMCLMSLNNVRNNKFNHVFFDETFEKLDPPLQRAVLQLLREIAKVKSSVFLITHSAAEIRQEVDQTWEVSRGGSLSISKS